MLPKLKFTVQMRWQVDVKAVSRRALNHLGFHREQRVEKRRSDCDLEIEDDLAPSVPLVFCTAERVCEHIFYSQPSRFPWLI